MVGGHELQLLSLRISWTRRIRAKIGTVVRRGLYRGILVMRDLLILFSVKSKFRKLFFVTRDIRFCVTREEPEMLTDIRDFATLFYVILRRKFSEWLESSPCATLLNLKLSMRAFNITSLEL